MYELFSSNKNHDFINNRGYLESQIVGHHQNHRLSEATSSCRTILEGRDE